MDDTKFTTDDSIFPKDIQCLLQTNDIPTSSQALKTTQIREECRSKLSGLENEMQKVQAEIERQKAVLTRLHERHAEKSREIEYCSHILSPIRRMLPEILGEIFTYCLPSDGLAAPNVAPLLLCQVCSVWRAICISDPRLWTHFVIKMSPDNVMDPTTHFLHAERWFQRAKDMSLSLHLDIQVSMPRGVFDVPLVNPNFLNASVEKLAESSFFQRIGRLEVNGNDLCAVPSLIPQNNQFDRLETLRLNFRHGFIANPEGQRSFQNAHRLRHLSITSAGRQPIPISIFPWHQLTNLHLSHCLGSRTFASVLSQCRNLQEATVHLMDEFPAMKPPLGTEVVILSQLTKLSITFNDAGSPYIFANILMPSLTALTLGSALPDGLLGMVNRQRLLFRYDDWEPYLYHQLGQLRKLSITKPRTFDTQDFISLLRSTPLISKLEISIQWTLPELDKLVTGLMSLIEESDSLARLRRLRILCRTTTLPSHTSSPVASVEEVAHNFSELIRRMHKESGSALYHRLPLRCIHLTAPNESWTPFFDIVQEGIKPCTLKGLVLSMETKNPLNTDVLGYGFPQFALLS